MRQLIAALTAAAALAVAAPAALAQDAPDKIPPPHPILTKIGSTPMVELSDGGGGLPYLGAATSYNAGDWEPALKTFHDSGVYDTEIAQIDAVASKWLAQATHQRHAMRARRAKARAAHHGGHDPQGAWWNKKLALVLDIDETSLSNYSAIVADNFTFGTNSRNEAINKVGVAIKPTLDLFNQAKAAGVDVFFITGRGEAVRQSTTENLTEQGYSGWKDLILKPADFTGTTVAYKSGARAAIEAQGYRILASVGDQYSDLAGGHEEEAFKLPNPFYFLP